MSEYIFVHLIDKQPVGSELGQSIPLHMTLLHWFESNNQPEVIIEAANLALKSIGRIATTTTQEDLFGPEQDIPVVRLDRKPELLHLHSELLSAMEDVGATFDERWTGIENWNPHVTNKPDTRFYPGDEIFVNDIDLITRSRKNKHRKILHRFELKTQ